MTLALSAAIQRGALIPGPYGFAALPYFEGYAACPLGAALLGSLPDREIAPFWAYIRAISHDSLCSYMHKNLLRVFPHLGATVRTWPLLASNLEREFPGLLPRANAVTKYPSKHRDPARYRPEIHVSLWRAITSLHGYGWEKSRIAEYLSRAGL